VLRTVSTLRAAAWLVAAQAAGLVVLTFVYLVALVFSTPSNYAAAATTTVFVALAAVGLGLCARGLAQRRRWARSPVLVLQLVTMPVAIGLVQGGLWYVGVPLLVWVLAVVVLLFAPGTNAALRTGEARA
jgi:uncharacterized membrane protein YhaH (DUF805 family)